MQEKLENAYFKYVDAQLYYVVDEFSLFLTIGLIYFRIFFQDSFRGT